METLGHRGGMPALLPRVLFPTAEFSLAELSAARLDGELVAVDDGFTPVDEPSTLALRLQSLAPLLGPRLIVERQSALWVHGFRPFPPTTHQVCVRAGARWRVHGSARLTIREVVMADSDVISVYGAPVTSMLRTAVDIARSSPTLSVVEHAQLAALLQSAGASLAECRELLDRSRHLPHKARALARLAEALGRCDSAAAHPVHLTDRTRHESAAAHPVHVVDRVDAPDGVQHAVEMGRVTHLEHEPANREAVA